MNGQRDGLTAPVDWWKDFFSGLMVEFWKSAIPDEATRSDADFFERILSLSPGSRVLDAPCGHGRFSIEFAQRGHHVTGVDLSADFLAAARASAEALGLSLAWRHSDMRDLPWEDHFDAVLCAGNSFGYFDDAGNAVYLTAAARALKPGGRLLLESGWVAESLLPRFRETLDINAGGLRFTVQNTYVPQTGRVENVFSVARGGQSETKAASHRVYMVNEVLAMLRRAGFTSFACFDGSDGLPYRLGSPRLLLVARKDA